MAINLDMTSTWPIAAWEDGDWVERADEIADEYPLTIQIDGEEFATMVCTPTDLDDLVLGFLASEGVIRFADDVESMTVDRERGFAYIALKHKRPIDPTLFSKRFIGSCCGKSRQFYLQSDAQTARTVMSRLKISADQCFRLMRQLQQSSDAFQRTGGVHNAAICTTDRLLAARTDIGRHNALDKLFGYCLRERIRTSETIIAFSGRISSEVLLKTAKIGAGILLSKSAPTRLGLELAEELGITVVGFIRGGRLNVYTHRERLDLSGGDTLDRPAHEPICE